MSNFSWNKLFFMRFVEYFMSPQSLKIPTVVGHHVSIPPVLIAFLHSSCLGGISHPVHHSCFLDFQEIYLNDYSEKGLRCSYCNPKHESFLTMHQQAL